MGIFGWSLPPGVTTLPGEEDEGPCEVCGNSVNNCICPECPVCGEYGNTNCYLEHGLELNRKQIKDLEHLIDYMCFDEIAEQRLSKSYLLEDYLEE